MISKIHLAFIIPFLFLLLVLPVGIGVRGPSEIKWDTKTWLLVYSMFVCWKLLLLVLCINYCLANIECPADYKRREDNCCATLICPADHGVSLCRGTGKDTCHRCPKGLINPQEVDTKDFTYTADYELCNKPDCSCTPEAVLINAEDCKRKGKKICLCDRSRGYYGDDPNICRLADRTTRNKARHPGYELNEYGIVQQCKAGYYKSTADESICIVKSKCPVGFREASYGSATEDRVCERNPYSSTTSTPDKSTQPITSSVPNHSAEETSNENLYIIIGVVSGVVTVFIIIIAVRRTVHFHRRGCRCMYHRISQRNTQNGTNGHLGTQLQEQSDLGNQTIIQMHNFPTQNGTLSSREEQHNSGTGNGYLRASPRQQIHPVSNGNFHDNSGLYILEQPRQQISSVSNGNVVQFDNTRTSSQRTSSLQQPSNGSLYEETAEIPKPTSVVDKKAAAENSNPTPKTICNGTSSREKPNSASEPDSLLFSNYQTLSESFLNTSISNRQEEEFSAQTSRKTAEEESNEDDFVSCNTNDNGHSSVSPQAMSIEDNSLQTTGAVEPPVGIVPPMIRRPVNDAYIAQPSQEDEAVFYPSGAENV